MISSWARASIVALLSAGLAAPAVATPRLVETPLAFHLPGSPAGDGWILGVVVRDDAGAAPHSVEIALVLPSGTPLIARLAPTGLSTPEAFRRGVLYSCRIDGLPAGRTTYHYEVTPAPYFLPTRFPRYGEHLDLVVRGGISSPTRTYDAPRIATPAPAAEVKGATRLMETPVAHPVPAPRVTPIRETPEHPATPSPSIVETGVIAAEEAPPPPPPATPPPEETAVVPASPPTPQPLDLETVVPSPTSPRERSESPPVETETIAASQPSPIEFPSRDTESAATPPPATRSSLNTPGLGESPSAAAAEPAPEVTPETDMIESPPAPIILDTPPAAAPPPSTPTVTILPETVPHDYPVTIEVTIPDWLSRDPAFAPFVAEIVGPDSVSAVWTDPVRSDTRFEFSAVLGPDWPAGSYRVRVITADSALSGEGRFTVVTRETFLSETDAVLTMSETEVTPGKQFRVIVEFANESPVVGRPIAEVVSEFGGSAFWDPYSVRGNRVEFAVIFSEVWPPGRYEIWVRSERNGRVRAWGDFRIVSPVTDASPPPPP